MKKINISQRRKKDFLEVAIHKAAHWVPFTNQSGFKTHSLKDIIKNTAHVSCPIQQKNKIYKNALFLSLSLEGIKPEIYSY